MPLRTKKQTTDVQNRASNLFILVLLLIVLYFSYLLFKPFIGYIAISAVLVAIFYPVYLKIVFWTRGSLSLASFLMCVAVLLVIIGPFSLFIFYLAKQIIEAYSTISPSIVSGAAVENVLRGIAPVLDFIGVNRATFDIQGFIIDSVIAVRGHLLSAASTIISATTSFIFGLVVVLITMFFLFKDGKTMLTALMNLTPLSNKYDKLIWMKFREVSYSAIIATLITAIAQGIMGAIGFLILGLPALIPGVLMTLASFIPYVGAFTIWIPVVIYLFLTGDIGAGIFLSIWGSGVSVLDNVLRPLLMKGKSEIHPMIIFFAIFGGIFLMGFWGMVFGPLIIALLMTILHIYQYEFSDVLEQS